MYKLLQTKELISLTTHFSFSLNDLSYLNVREGWMFEKRQATIYQIHLGTGGKSFRKDKKCW